MSASMATSTSAERPLEADERGRTALAPASGVVSDETAAGGRSTFELMDAAADSVGAAGDAAGMTGAVGGAAGTRAGDAASLRTGAAARASRRAT